MDYLGRYIIVEIGISDGWIRDRLKDKIKSLYERIEDLEFTMLDITTQNEFTFSKEDLVL